MVYIRYLAVRPEVVVSVVTKGKYPEQLPEWLLVGATPCSECKETASASLESLAQTKIPVNQIFIVLIAFPTKDDLAIFNPKWIRGIYVYSEVGKKLLINLFKNHNCSLIPAEIHIRTDYFDPLMLNRSQVSQPVGVHLPKERKRSPSLSPPPSPSLSPPHDLSLASPAPLVFSNAFKVVEPEMDLAELERLDSFTNHIAFLQKAFQQAKNTIVIITESVSETFFKDTNLFRLIESANRRHVAISLYLNDQPVVDPAVKKFLEQNVTLRANRYVKSNVLVVDDLCVAVGSFNWLGSVFENETVNQNASLVYRGEKCPPLKDRILEYLLYFAKQEFESPAALRAKDKDSYFRRSWSSSIANQSLLFYLPTVEHHCDFIYECLLIARERIVVCSAAISLNGEYSLNFKESLLKAAADRKVQIYFICSPEQIEKSKFGDYIFNLNSPNIHLVPVKNIRLNTLITDDHVVAEGSISWLSLSKADALKIQKHEVTLVSRGRAGKPLIEQGFYESELGKYLMERYIDKEPILKRLRWGN